MTNHESFIQLTGPILGESLAKELFHQIVPGTDEQYQGIAAFFRGEYDDTSMHLENNDWIIIRETVEHVSGDMDIDMLTALMGELLSRGVLA
jgi:hypothetical protein